MPKNPTFNNGNINLPAGKTISIDGTEVLNSSGVAVYGDDIDLSAGKTISIDGTQVITAQQSTIADVTVTYTANDPSIVPDGAVTVADGSIPTVAELLEAVVEVNAKVGAIITALQAHGLIA